MPLRSCARRGAAIDLVLDRGRENRSQIVFTRARGRDVMFWQSPRTRKQARPNVRTPTARAAGFADLEIVADSHERYPYRFAGETRPLAEEWTYRFLAAARAWAETEAAVSGRMPMGGDLGAAPAAPAEPGLPSAEVRAWASLEGIAVPARGKLSRDVWGAWHAAHPSPSPELLPGG